MPGLELDLIPERIKALPIDPVRKVPVPWFVAWIDGKPEFRAMDHTKLVRAVREKRCWVCGEPLGRLMTFVIGPMCGVNRVSSEPPSHTECARFSAKHCPFLARPHMTRREAGPDLEAMGATSAGVMIERNPGVTLLWTTRGYTPFGDGNGGVLFRIGDPASVEWYRERRPATREEVEESVRTGLPILADIAGRQEGAMKALAIQKAALERLYPAAIPIDVEPRRGASVCPFSISPATATRVGPTSATTPASSP
jgi:hypothetical protein